MSTTAVAPLTIEDAELLVATARRAAEEAGVTVSVTVLDAGGHRLAFRRDARAVLFIAGGVPVHRDGRLIGAIGVGGGAPAQDHGFATAAIQVLV